MRYENYTEVIKAAKQAFDGIDRTQHEKQLLTDKKTEDFPKKKMIGFIDGMRELTVYC